MSRIFMEQSVPELQDLQRKGLFDKKEISMIMRRRTGFEQRTAGGGVQPRDFTRYADFEANLDQLRLKRAARLSASGAADTAPSISDLAGFRRVVGIYDRAVRRFPGETALWQKYIRYAKDKDAVRVVYRAYGRLLSLQPRNPDAWMSAAKYEFEENANASGARDLYMRGLRFNADSEEMWLSYAQFELTYVAKLVTRRRVMGLHTEKQQREDMAAQQAAYEERLRASDAAGLAENADMIRVDAAEAEAAEAGSEAEAEAENSENSTSASASVDVLGNAESNPVLRGDIALTVFDSSLSQLLKDIAPDMKAAVALRTCRRFLAMFDSFDALDRDHLYLHVLRYMQAAHPDALDTVFVDVTLPLRTVAVTDASLAESLQLSVNKFLAYKSKLEPRLAADLSKRYVDHLSETYLEPSGVSDKTNSLLKAIIQKCR